MARRLRTLPLTLGLATLVATLALTMAPAQAEYGGDTTPTGPSDTVPANTQGAQTDEGGTVSGTAGACHFVSTVNSLGTACPGGKLAGLKNIKDLLGGEKFKRCWWDRFTAEEHQATGYYDSDTQTWFFKRCLEGIDPKTLDVTGPIYVTSDPFPIPNEQIGTLETIGPNQQTLVDNQAKTIPYPFAVVSPMDRARVGSWLSFADGQTVHEVDVPALGAVLRAVEDKITVKPLGAGSPVTKECPGSGHIAARGEDPDPSGNCWYRYLKSSADQPDNTYPVVISAHWTVTVTDGAGTRVLNQFTKSQVTRIPVTEIQAINVQ